LLQSMKRVPFKNMKSFVYQSRTNMTIAEFYLLFRNFRYLEVLNISYASDLTTDTLSQIQKLRNLRELRLAKCSGLDKKVVRNNVTSDF
jgi:hypothetical protein